MSKWFFLPLVAIFMLLSSCKSEPPPPVQVQGGVVVRSLLQGSNLYPEGVLIRVLDSSGQVLAETHTNKIGWFHVAVQDAEVGDELRVQAIYTDPNAKLSLKQAKRVTVSKDRYAYVPQMAFVDLADAELRKYQDSWFDAFGNVKVEDPGGRFVRVWAHAFDPELDRPFFPGNYRDAEGNKIISNGFLFVTAQDASGQQVSTLDEPVTVFFNIPNTHRYYLRDVSPGNGLYEVPMYLYDEELDTWVRKGTGVVVDAGYQPVPESDEEQVRTDPYYGKLYVRFRADHFSVWNVDHPLPPCSQ